MPAPPTVAEIRPDACYPLEDFMRLIGFGRHAMRAARRNGLVVRRTANRAFVLGSDWIDYLRREGRVTDATESKPAS